MYLWHKYHTQTQVLYEYNIFTERGRQTADSYYKIFFILFDLTHHYNFAFNILLNGTAISFYSMCSVWTPFLIWYVIMILVAISYGSKSFL
jgi:hypothetical protein